MSEGFKSFLSDLQSQSLPPIETWKPSYQASIDLLIDQEGRWFYEGTEFTRPRLVKLLSGLLNVSADGQYYLTSPAEKLAIQVVDVPFLITEAECEGDELERSVIFSTSLGDKVLLSNPEAFQIRAYRGQEIPYVEIRNGLFARVNRQVFYQLVDWSEENSQCSESNFGFYSEGIFFSLGEVTW